jgi:hypothetical protein
VYSKNKIKVDRESVICVRIFKSDFPVFVGLSPNNKNCDNFLFSNFPNLGFAFVSNFQIRFNETNRFVLFKMILILVGILLDICSILKKKCYKFFI